MESSDQKEVKAARPTNLARIASAIIFIVLYSLYEYKIVLYFAIIQFCFSLLWFWIIEKQFTIYKKFPTLWYAPASIDVFFATASVYITGISYSPVLIAYILITCMSSVDLIRARGLFTTIASSLSYLIILVLAMYKLIPYINILSNSNSEISLFSAILSSLLLIIGCFTANSVIFQIYFQLNMKNDELGSSLEKINRLKLRQDADYALTARLMEPFSRNFVNSKYIRLEFFLKQKKSFSFKNHPLEIGGDILIADEIFFNETKYIFFLNGDAMGKSMQGACGALVLGAITKSILTNSQNHNRLHNIDPQTWLLNSVSEIHKIFESFDGSMLASVFIGLIEEKTGRIFYINTEHPEAILYRDNDVSFLKEHSKYHKLGTVGLPMEFNELEFFQLQDGDIIFIGSDGKDDIVLKSDDTKQINHNEFLFSQFIKNAKGDLSETVEEMIKHGELTDDLSIIKISFTASE